MPRGGARPGAGRKKGGKNLATIQRELLRTVEYQTGQKKLAVTILREFMQFFDALAWRARAQGDVASFKEFAALAAECARTLCPYEVPRLHAVAVAAPPPQTEQVITMSIFENGEKVGRYINGEEITGRGDDQCDLKGARYGVRPP